MKYGLGCIESPTDLRDYKLKKSSVNSVELPEEFELTYNHKIKNQQSVCSCTAHAAASLLEYYNPSKTLSTNFIYGIRKRLYESFWLGMSIKEACKIMTTYGDMVEADCPGNTEIEDVFDIASEAFDDKSKLEYAYRFKTQKYVRLFTKSDIKYFIYKYGPVIIGFNYYDDFKYNKETHAIDRTNNNIDILCSGSHSVLVYGWNKDGWLCQNSWGTRWGNKGLFVLKYEDGILDAFGLIDDPNLSETTDIVDPTYNISLLDKIYKLINTIIAKLFKK